jgi:hypothetical protein
MVPNMVDVPCLSDVIVVPLWWTIAFADICAICGWKRFSIVKPVSPLLGNIGQARRYVGGESEHRGYATSSVGAVVESFLTEAYPYKRFFTKPDDISASPWCHGNPWVRKRCPKTQV